jgi:hypothetical protein
MKLRETCNPLHALRDDAVHGEPSLVDVQQPVRKKTVLYKYALHTIATQVHNPAVSEYQ